MTQLTSSSIRANHFGSLLTALLVCTGLLASSGNAGAVLLPVTNFSFELPLLADEGFTTASTGGIPGWTQVDGPTRNQGVFNPGVPLRFTACCPDGDQTAYSNGNGGTISQVLAAVLTANTQYTLTVAVGARNDVTFGPYRIELLAGTTVLDFASGPLPPKGGFIDNVADYLGPVHIQ